MSPSFLGLRTCIYRIPDHDLAKAKAWYTEVFGQGPYFDEPFYIGFEIGGYELGLLPTDPAEHSPSDTVLTYWGVDDAEESFARLIAKGATSYEDPHNVGGDIVVAGAKDPWGNVIGLIYNPEFKLPG